MCRGTARGRVADSGRRNGRNYIFIKMMAGGPCCSGVRYIGTVCTHRPERERERERERDGERRGGRVNSEDASRGRTWDGMGIGDETAGE